MLGESLERPLALLEEREQHERVHRVRRELECRRDTCRGGGGIAIALAVALRDAREQLPAALHAISPFCDLTIGSESALASADPWLSRDRLRMLAASYLHGGDPATPLISPVFAALRALPPLLVEAAVQEALRDDAVALAAAAAAAGVATTLELVPDSVHSFVLFAFLEESERALERFAEHVRQAVSLARHGAPAI